MKVKIDGQEYDIPTTIIVGQDLKRMRIKAKVTTSVAAEYMGLKSRKTIENWEAGVSTPGIQQFMLLCRYYDFISWKIVAQCLERIKTCNPVENYQDIDLNLCQ